MQPYYQSGNVILYHGDAREVVPFLIGVSSIVTDPPYGLSFMGKKWDYDVPGVEIWEACLAALSPGGQRRVLRIGRFGIEWLGRCRRKSNERKTNKKQQR
jgi:hypothetical protein